MRRTVLMVCSLLLLLTFQAIVVNAQTSAFTYQGKLTDAGLTASGQYDLTFRLWDQISGGTQVGTDVVNEDVQVSSGIFTVNLDFGASPFTSATGKYLEILVRPGVSVGAYTILAPRQPITSSPFAIKTINAASADSLSGTCALCVTDGHIFSIDGGKVTGTVNNATNADFALQSTNSTNAQNAVTAQNSINLGGVPSNQYLQSTGDGSQLTNVAGTFKWNVITANQQAESNKGYLFNTSAELTITLPTAAQVGDVIRVIGLGTGGWHISQNAGQSIINGGSLDKPWIPRDANRQWLSVASSADGTKLVACAGLGQIYTSVDSGASWLAGGPNLNWRSVAISADGTRLVATGPGLNIYTSANSGATWTSELGAATSRNWQSIAVTADGTKMVAVVYGGYIYRSGPTLSDLAELGSFRNWVSVASSADGSKLVAAVNGGPGNEGQIYTSTDSGVIWTPRESNRGWRAVASSADGTKLAAVVLGGQIYTSSDSGVTWTPREANRIWSAVASSADGTKLVATADNGRIYTTEDSGVIWTPRESARRWFSVASSADGNKLVAVDFGLGSVNYGGQIYTSPALLNTTAGTAGALTGKAASSVELIYLGGGQFYILSSTGNISSL
jgi:hypothetical protein